jgi:metallo-beta-lactamase family protein
MTDTTALLTMLGGARTVTGSKFLVQFDDQRVLVDCGLFQGLKELRERNWSHFPIDPASIDAVVITHAHLDHCGYLPRLVRAGYQGPVHVTYDTGRLMSVVLADSGRLLEEEAKYANRAGYSRHSPALALYTEDDAWRALELLTSVPYEQPVEVARGVSVTFRNAGHILGSSGIELRLATEKPTTVRFSGDLGRQMHPLLQPPAPLGDADWVLIESTYGNRVHQSDESVDRLADLIHRTVKRGGLVIIPAFAVDRTEVLLYHLRMLSEAGRLPHVPIYVDSPMALAALDIYKSAIAEEASDIRPELHGRHDIFDLPELHEVRDTEGSKKLSRRSQPGIIIAGAGMASGGRVIHHLARHLPDPRNSVALVGFQAAGTRGRSLLDGATALKIHGQYVRVRAEVVDLTGFSVHADADELIDWLKTATRPPSGVFVVHGEPDEANALHDRIERELDWTAAVPRDGERLRLAVP